MSASPGPVTCEAENSQGTIRTTEHIPEPGMSLSFYLITKNAICL